MNFPPPEQHRDRAIVLVHGAWVGEWSWLPVMPSLLTTGRPVLAVSLTGHGSRSHESGPDVSLDDHAADVVGIIDAYDLTNVTLVGHSYGGRVISQASQTIGDRLASMVFLDAHTPVAKDSGQEPARVASAAANGGMLPFAELYTPDPAIVGGPGGVKWFLDRTMPQSFKCLTSPWVAPLPDHVRRTFIWASRDGERSRFSHYAKLCQELPDWDYYEFDGPHFLMMSHPVEVAEIIAAG